MWRDLVFFSIANFVLFLTALLLSSVFAVAFGFANYELLERVSKMIERGKHLRSEFPGLKALIELRTQFSRVLTNPLPGLKSGASTSPLPPGYF
jgi:hypothetical protein